MSNEAATQALEAFIAEAKKSGVDVEAIAQKAKAGIMGNEIYSWISTLEKTKATESLTSAITSISELGI